MTYNAKAILIQLILIVVSGIIMLVLILFFQSSGLKILMLLSSCIMTTTLGFYILFGKYVYLRGVVITKLVRIGVGLFFILLMPTLWLIFYLTGRFG